MSCPTCGSNDPGTQFEPCIYTYPADTDTFHLTTNPAAGAATDQESS